MSQRGLLHLSELNAAAVAIGPHPFGILPGSKHFWIQLSGPDPQSNYLGWRVRWDGSVSRSSDSNARSECRPAKQLGSSSPRGTYRADRADGALGLASYGSTLLLPVA